MKDLVPLNEKGDLISMIEETAQHGIIISICEQCKHVERRSKNSSYELKDSQEHNDFFVVIQNDVLEKQFNLVICSKDESHFNQNHVWSFEIHFIYVFIVPLYYDISNRTNRTV